MFIEAVWRRECETHPSIPPQNIPRRNLKDDSANSLTQLIIKHIQYCGWQAERVSSSGRYVADNPKRDLFGRVQIQGGRWIPPTSTNGTADISATIGGRSVKIEVKFGADRMSAAQIAYKESVERSGGVYVVAHTFSQYLESMNAAGLLSLNTLRTNNNEHTD